MKYFGLDMSLIYESRIQLESISTFFPLEYFWAWGYYHILSPKNQTKKVVKMHTIFELYQVFIYTSLYQTVVIFTKYMLFAKIIETF